MNRPWNMLIKKTFFWKSDRSLEIAAEIISCGHLPDFWCAKTIFLVSGGSLDCANVLLSVLLLFIVKDRGTNETQEQVSRRYIAVQNLIGMGFLTLECVYLRRSPDHEVDHGLIQGNTDLEDSDLRVEIGLGWNVRKTLQNFPKTWEGIMRLHDSRTIHIDRCTNWILIRSILISGTVIIVCSKKLWCCY